MNKFFANLKRNGSKRFGLFTTIFFSTILVLIFYGKPLAEIGNTFFASDGDGLKDYYNAIYYIKYDEAWFHTNSMNYPYGESIFYTGMQPFLSIPLKFIDNKIVELSPSFILAVFNLKMLISLVLGAVFLYLLLIHFKLPWWYSVLVALGIAFLSPQLARMPGHFSLSYVFAIPAMLFLVAKFHERPRIWLSCLIGSFVLWGFLTHAYMVGFFAIILIGYWFFAFASNKGKNLAKIKFFYLALQFLIPVFIIIVISMLADGVADRTSYPAGFLYYKGTPEGVFLPVEKPYGGFVGKLVSLQHLQWESISYIGLVGVLGFVAFFVALIFKLATGKFKAIVSPSGIILLDLFFWVSILALLFSFGLPFIIGELKYLIQYIGPLKQFRGIARFGWIFFYVFNIVVFLQIYNLKHSQVLRPIWIGLVIVSLAIFYYDTWSNARLWSSFVNNKVPEVSDWNNQAGQNAWVSQIDATGYQAIIPLPNFHVGSEIVWREAHCGIARNSYLVSLKTGIPSMGVMLSRTSISQTLSALEFFQEPYRFPKIISEFNAQKPFLLVVSNNCERLSEANKKLIEKSSFLTSAVGFSLYELRFDSLVNAFENSTKRIRQELEGFQSKSENGDYIAEGIANCVFLSLGESGEDSYFNGGTLKAQINDGQWQVVDEIPNLEPGTDYIFSFWINGIDRDVFLRTRLLILQTDASGEGYYETDLNLGETLSIVDGNWGLVERTINLRNPGDKLKWRMYSKEKKSTSCAISSLLIRPLSFDFVKEGEGWIMKNNRYFQ